MIAFKLISRQNVSLECDLHSKADMMWWTTRTFEKPRICIESSHPQAKFTASCATSNPVHRGMITCSCGHSGKIEAELRKLATIAGVHIDVTIHVCDTEPLDAILRL